MNCKFEAYNPSADLIGASSTLLDCVRGALQVRRTGVHAVIAAACLTSVTPLALGAAFPPILPLGSLLPSGGGDGTQGFVLSGVNAADFSGDSVSGAGDVNGDGVDDVIVGAFLADPAGVSDAGKSYVVFGSTQGFPANVPLASLYPAGGGDGSRGFVLTGIDENDSSGASVSAAGDVNGDGVDDLIIGACCASPHGNVNAGASYVVFGSTQGFPAIVPLASLYPAGGGDGGRGFVLTGIDAGDESGFVSAAGDVNGDGIDDLIVGAPAASPRGVPSAGESYVVFGSTEGFPAVLPLESLYPDGGGDGSRGFVLTGIDLGDASGLSASAAGDVNADGVDDIIIGADRADPGGARSAGESYVVFGSTQGFPAIVPLASLLPSGGGDGSRGFVLPGVNANDLSGRSVSGAGDINADGIDDLIIGASFVGAVKGASYVVFGSTQAFPAILPLQSLRPNFGGDGSRGFVLSGIDENDMSGASVSAAGDVNGDSIDDLIIGAPGASTRGVLYTGESYVVFGSTEGFPALVPLAGLYPAGGGDGSRGFVLPGAGAFHQSGETVRAAGDVNGDGIDDVIVGASYANPRGEYAAGESFVVFGRSAVQ